MSTQHRFEGEKWQSIYKSDALAKRRLRTHFQKLTKIGILEEPREIRIMDVGCGSGEMLEILADKGFRNLIGIDLDFSHESHDHHEPGNLHGKWQYISGSATQIPIQSGTVDWAFCAHSLHHMGGPKQIQSFIDDALRCLKPGGKLALIDHYDSWQLRLALLILMSPLAMLTPWSRDFRNQILEEKGYFFEYLTSWPTVKGLFTKLPGKTAIYRQDLFFFYLVLTK